MVYKEVSASPEWIRQLISLSEQWENEGSCRGYRKNSASDIDGRRIFVALNGKEIAGYLFGKTGFAPSTDSVMVKGTPFFELEELYIRPSARSHGTGSHLFAYAKRVLDGEVECILLSTATKDMKAILHFYTDLIGMEFWSARLFMRIPD